MSALASFKLMNCPKGLHCPNDKCIFKHPDEDEHGVRHGQLLPLKQHGEHLIAPAPTTAPEAPNPAIQPTTQPAVRLTLDSGSGPRKRQKIASGSSLSHMGQPTKSPVFAESSSKTQSIQIVTNSPQTTLRNGSQEPPAAPALPDHLGDTSSNATATNTAHPTAPISTEYDPASPAWVAPKPLPPTPTVARKDSSPIPPKPSVVVSAPPRETSRPPLKRKYPAPSTPQPSQHKKAAIETPPSARSGAGPKAAPKPKPRKPETLNPRLVVPAPASHDIRLKLLKLLHAEISRLNTEVKKMENFDDVESVKDVREMVLTDQEVVWRALDEEEKLTSKGPVYTNVIKNRITSLKRMDSKTWLNKECQMNPYAAMYHGKHPVDTGLSSEQEITFARGHLITPLKDLAVHGYCPKAPSPAQIERTKVALENSAGFETCERCNSRFQVFPDRREDGTLTTGGRCTFHHGRTYFPNNKSSRHDSQKSLKRYRCCNEAVGDSPGCTTHSTHVFKAGDPTRLSVVLPFKETPPNPRPDFYRVVAFDCEMGHTAYGMELIRLTVTNWPTGEVILDILVQPLGAVLDLNSRYSGVFPEHMRKAELWTKTTPPPRQKCPGAPYLTPAELWTDHTPPLAKTKIAEPPRCEKKDPLDDIRIVATPGVARDIFHSMISPETVIIGHGLENDLNCCRMIHRNVIDTILLFPHRKGLPMRNGLKALAFLHLGAKIQEQDGEKGHDSAEDSKTTGELVRFKIKEMWHRMQREGWTWVDGEMVAPEKA